MFAAAVSWLTGTLLGTLAMSVAMIAVASIGLLMVAGRIDIRRAGQVIFGCFILFGASSIASGIMAGVRTTSSDSPAMTTLPAPPAYPAPTAAAPPAPTPFDPYAGAALPQR